MLSDIPALLSRQSSTGQWHVVVVVSGWCAARGGLNGRCPERAAPTGLGGRCGWRAERPLCSLPLTPGRCRWGGACDPKRAPLDAPPSFSQSTTCSRLAWNAGRIHRKLLAYIMIPSHLNSDGPTITSTSLIQRIQLKDEVAWSRFVDLYSPLIWGWCRGSSLEPNDADDVSQEVFTAVARAIAQYERNGSFRGWLWQVTRKNKKQKGSKKTKGGNSLFNKRDLTPFAPFAPQNIRMSASRSPSFFHYCRSRNRIVRNSKSLASFTAATDVLPAGGLQP